MLCMFVGSFISAFQLSVGLSVCHNRDPANMAELIEIPFGLCIRVGPRKHSYVRWGSHWRQLVNTVEPSMHGSNVAFLTTCFSFWIVKYEKLV